MKTLYRPMLAPIQHRARSVAVPPRIQSHLRRRRAGLAASARVEGMAPDRRRVGTSGGWGESLTGDSRSSTKPHSGLKGRRVTLVPRVVGASDSVRVCAALRLGKRGSWRQERVATLVRPAEAVDCPARLLALATMLAGMIVRLGRFGVGVLTTTAAVLVLVAGCDDEPDYRRLPPTSSATPSAAAPNVSPSLTTEQQILAQYERFWTEAAPASDSASNHERRAILAPVVMNPQLDLMLNNAAVLNARGERSYGVDRPLRQTVVINGDLALVRGCLDSSKSGIADKASGRPKTRGVPQNPVLANFRRGADFVWRISGITYPGGRSC